MTENQRLILNLLDANTGQTRNELAERSGLPPTTVADVLLDLYALRRVGRRRAGNMTTYLRLAGRGCALQEAWKKAPENYFQDMLDRRGL